MEAERYPFWVNRVAGLLQMADGFLCFLGIHRWGTALWFYTWWLDRDCHKRAEAES